MCEKHFRTYMQQQMANACRFGLVLALAAACSAAALGTYDAGRSSELAGELEALGLSSESIKVEATALAEWIVAVRRRLHKTPELMYDLAETASIVREVLDELGVPYRYPIASHGIVATIGSGKQPVIALRSDMDALPVHEVAMDGTDDFVSERPGKMHACGHDAHMAMLLGAAKLLKSREKALTGTVQLVFQPAEEGGAGGLAMLLEGVSDSTEKVKRMFGMHVWPWLPTGSFGMKSGPLMAGAGTFEVVIKGKGGHAAAGVGMGVVDPTVAAAAAVSSLQSIVARDVAPDDQAVVSVTMIHGGNAYNVVPDQVTFGGTLRAFSRKTYDLIERRTKEVIEHTAAAHGCQVEMYFTSFAEDCLKTTGLPDAFASGCTYPPVVNDDGMYALAKGAARSLVGEGLVHEATATMGGEDFAYFAEKVPANFVYLGIGNELKNTTVGLHSPNFKLDEEALPLGVALHVTTALHALHDLKGIDAVKVEL